VERIRDWQRVKKASFAFSPDVRPADNILATVVDSIPVDPKKLKKRVAVEDAENEAERPNEVDDCD
jgi:hypothetical protein